MPNPEEETREEIKREEYHYRLNGGRAWIAVILAILVATAGYSLFRLSREDQQRADLLRTNQALQSSLDQAKSDLHAAADKLNAADTRTQIAQFPAQAVLAESAPENAQASASPARPIHKAIKASSLHQANSARGTKDPRWSQMDAKLADQQQQLEGAKSDIARTREDLEGRIGSTRDELNGAIAKTSDEVAELRKRGERNYYEFDLNKSSEFARTGPVSLALRKANVKRKFYDLALIVNDQKLEKKHANLYEPLWISVPDRPEPVQVVVNSITKDHIKGYLSEPKYKKSELAGNVSGRTTMPNSNTSGSTISQPDLAAPDKGSSNPPEQQ